jgi:hypothetical protein
VPDCRSVYDSLGPRPYHETWLNALGLWGNRQGCKRRQHGRKRRRMRRKRKRKRRGGGLFWETNVCPVFVRHLSQSARLQNGAGGAGVCASARVCAKDLQAPVRSPASYPYPHPQITQGAITNDEQGERPPHPRNRIARINLLWHFCPLLFQPSGWAHTCCSVLFLLPNLYPTLHSVGGPIFRCFVFGWCGGLKVANEVQAVVHFDVT